MIKAKYPDEIQITEKTQMQIIAAHEYSGEHGVISLMVGALNITSYYTGPESSYYFLLLLNLDDDSDAFEPGLIDIAQIILQNIQDDKYITMIPSLFQRISIFPTLSEEQHLAMTFQDNIKRIVINRLRDEGIVSKSELSIWLKDISKQGFVDLDAILLDLIKMDLIKEGSVKGLPSELIFLTNDVLFCRVPPKDLIKDPTGVGLPEKLKNDYIIECTKFFKDYHPSDEDSIKILGLIADPQIYITLKLLKKSIVKRNEIEKLKKKGVDDIDTVLKALWDNKMIQVFQDNQGNEFYTLISDFYISKIFPKHILRIIKTSYENQSKANKVLVEYLKVLEDSYVTMKSKTEA